MRITFLLIFICFSRYAQSQIDFFGKKVDVTVTKFENISFKIDSLLIVGSGTSDARIFQDDLCNRLIKEFLKKKVYATYVYLGNSEEDVKNEYNLINKEGFKAILKIQPLGTSNFKATLKKSYILVPGANSVTTLSRTHYEQTIEFKLMRLNEVETTFWEAFSDIKCDLSEPVTAEKVADKMFKSFIIGKYLK